MVTKYHSDSESDSNQLSFEDQLELEAVQQCKLLTPAPFINNQQVLDKKAEEMDLKNIAKEKNCRLEWIETLVCTSSQKSDMEDSKLASDDLARELHFYKMALDASKFAKKQIEKTDKPFWRPQDYYAEMIKTDEHMLKIQKKHLEDQDAVKKAEDAKKQRLNKKFGKKIQAQKLLERQKKKSQELAKINQMKRRRTDSEYHKKPKKAARRKKPSNNSSV